MPDKTTFRISFHNNGKIYEIHAHEVSQSSMYGFIEVGDLIFDNRSQLLVDPSEEKLKAEFAEVKQTYIPMHAIIRIDEVEKQGQNRILETDGSTVTQFPGIPPSSSSNKQ